MAFFELTDDSGISRKRSCKHLPQTYWKACARTMREFFQERIDPTVKDDVARAWAVTNRIQSAC